MHAVLIIIPEFVRNVLWFAGVGGAVHNPVAFERIAVDVADVVPDGWSTSVSVLVLHGLGVKLVLGRSELDGPSLEGGKDSPLLSVRFARLESLPDLGESTARRRSVAHVDLVVAHVVDQSATSRSSSRGGQEGHDGRG